MPDTAFAAALLATLEARDRYTAAHSVAVASYARDISAHLGLSVAQQDLAHTSGLVHDIGKISLPAGVLEKPADSLTRDERREMQRHSETGERILANVAAYAEIASIVRHHHERWDGRGYPDGLAGEAIPLLSRVIAVADAYATITSDRPYVDALPSTAAREELRRRSGSELDPAMVAALEGHDFPPLPSNPELGTSPEALTAHGVLLSRLHSGALSPVRRDQRRSSRANHERPRAVERTAWSRFRSALAQAFSRIRRVG